MIALTAGAAAFVVALLLTAVVRRWTLRIGLLDVPNQRSSHQRATPRGGGIAIVTTVIGAAAWSALRGALAPGPACAWIVGGGLIALVGFLDDRHHLPARVRFAAHVLAAALAVWAAGGSPPLFLPGGTLALGTAGAVLAVVASVWSINFFNFMDGIDGLAAAQALFVCAAAVLIASSTGAPTTGGAMAAIVAGASAGFLAWNFPPARIFMGDVGSGFLGFAIALCALMAADGAPLTLWTWIVLHALFLTDSTVTLVMRFARGERVYEAHRQHAYQRLSRRWRSHAKVLSLFGVINLAWLLPLAFATVRYREYGSLLAFAALLPLCLGAIWVGAGSAEDA